MKSQLLQRPSALDRAVRFLRRDIMSADGCLLVSNSHEKAIWTLHILSGWTESRGYVCTMVLFEICWHDGHFTVKLCINKAWQNVRFSAGCNNEVLCVIWFPNFSYFPAFKLDHFCNVNIRVAVQQKKVAFLLEFESFPLNPPVGVCPEEKKTVFTVYLSSFKSERNASLRPITQDVALPCPLS